MVQVLWQEEEQLKTIYGNYLLVLEKVYDTVFKKEFHNLYLMTLDKKEMINCYFIDYFDSSKILLKDIKKDIINYKEKRW